MKQTLFSIKETYFNEVDCNDHDCKGCAFLTEDCCEGEPESCMQVREWFDKLCAEHEVNE